MDSSSDDETPVYDIENFTDMFGEPEDDSESSEHEERISVYEQRRRAKEARLAARAKAEEESGASSSTTSTTKQLLTSSSTGIVNRLPLRFIDDHEAMKEVVYDLIDMDVQPGASMARAMNKIRRKHKKFDVPITHAMILYTYRLMVQEGDCDRSEKLERAFMSNTMRSQSGVMVIAVFTSPYPKVGEKTEKFSCAFDCHYCPAEPGQPRSYLLQEPGVLRANRNGFDCCEQFWDRAGTYAVTGHPVDKIELLVLGGTWTSYPETYREEFIRDIFYAANVFNDRQNSDGLNFRKERLSVEEEQKINETAKCRVIGLTIETRPDQIWKRELRKLRKLGVTRVQLGVQHTDDAILKKINRGCTTADAVKAFKMLKDCCFKIDMHLMPDLPGSNVEMDEKMFEEVITGEHLQADQWKIYPTSTTPWTKIKEWYDEGSYVPYGDQTEVKEDGTRYNPMLEMLIRVKTKVPEWVRLNRVIRDIPGTYIEAGNAVVNMRQLIHLEMAKRGVRCRCIRCREVKSTSAVKQEDAELVVRKYRASGGDEYFLSFESRDRLTLYGFLRLRLSESAGAGGVFPELEKAALVRELHVYGRVVRVGSDVGEGDDEAVQHFGFGTMLLQRADEIAKEHGFTRIAVIAGVGTKEYYRKRGYRDAEYFLIKTLDRSDKLRRGDDVSQDRSDADTDHATTAEEEDEPANKRKASTVVRPYRQGAVVVLVAAVALAALIVWRRK